MRFSHPSALVRRTTCSFLLQFVSIVHSVNWNIYNLPRQPLRDSSVAVFLLRFVFVGKGESVFSQTSFSLLSMNRRLVVIRFVTELSPAISLGRKSSGRWHRHKFIDSPCAKGEINLISIRAWQTFLTDCSSSGLLYNAREEMFSLVQLLGYLTLSPCKHPQIEAVWKRFIELSTVSVEMALRVSISNLLETPRDKNAAVEFNEPILFCYLQLLVYYISTFICAS